jgi:cell wall-associated NlpC family hydrolase
MSVFMYSPGIKIYISTQNNGIIDVSDDATQGTLVRRSDGVSSFSFTLQNPFRKYAGVFTPNDRIVVMMKRVSWLRVFTGYLNQVPLVTAWPSSVQITASCSLKRLQYWFWDPGLEASQNLVAQAMSTAANPDDGGVSAAIIALLQNVVGWPSSKIHIAGIPQGWSTWAYKIASAVQADTAAADALAQQFYAGLGAGGIVGGVTGGGATVPAGALKAGTYAGQKLSAGQCQLATLIYNVCMQMGGSTRDATVGIMTAYQESRLQNLDYGTGTSLGLFQQEANAGWGTTAQRLNPTSAATAFFGVLLAMSNRNTLTLDQEAQAVQRSAYPAAYGQWETMAQAVVAILAAPNASSLSGSAAFSSVQANSKAGKANCTQFLGVALGLVESQQIPYLESATLDSAPNVAQPTYLDCSSFTQWVMYHTLGSLNGMPRTSQEQSAWCQSSGTIIDAQSGLNIPGALMFIGPPGASTHVEISCGTGGSTVGAHHTGTYAGVVTGAPQSNANPGGFTCAGLPPGIDYSAYKGLAAAYKQVPSGSALSSGANIPIAGQGLQVDPSSSEPWYNPADKFDSLFGPTPWFPTFDADAAAIANVFTGPRALLNDQPLLPYVKNLFTSSMRSYCSGPNGDLIAWFPDFYGIWGTAAIMRVEPIELQDFTVYWSDENLVTHQYVIAPPAQQIDLGSGATTGITISSSGQTVPIDVLYAMTTDGIASIDIPAIMYALFGLEPTTAAAQKFIGYVYSRFGARPDLEQLPGIVGPQGEFFAALMLFMRSWAYQYNSDVPLTFMPELWPGMLLQIPAFGFQAYCTTVTHTFQMGEGGFFNTTVNIAAPARLPGNDNNSGGQLIGLPVAGGLTSGTNLPIPGQAS